jgi:Glycosidases
MAIEDLWYKNAIIYYLDVEKYMDANGDGVGDFEGLSRRLDYLAGLGVTCVWLQPFYPSPNRDNGYDVSDYYGVHPKHGSPGDFVQFMNHAKALGMRVIVDLVVNHTSNEHPWFRAARSDPGSRFRNWYVWTDERPKDHDTGMVFPGVQKTTWSFDDAAGMWYFHRFYDHQPDLNTHHPAVRDEITKIMGYWLELGRLSPEQRAQVFAAFAPKKEMQLYDRGIRRRLAPMLGNDRRRNARYWLGTDNGACAGKRLSPLTTQQGWPRCR